MARSAEVRGIFIASFLMVIQPLLDLLGVG